MLSTVRRAFAKRRVVIAGKESFRHKSCRSSEGVAIRCPRNGEGLKSLGSSSATHHLQKQNVSEVRARYGPNFQTVMSHVESLAPTLDEV